MKIAIISKLTPEHPAWKHGKHLDVKIFTTKQSKKHKPQGKRPGAFLYPANASRLYIFEVEIFYRYNPRAAMIGTRGGPFLCVQRIL